MTAIEPTDALRCDHCGEEVGTKQGDTWVGSVDGRAWHNGCAPSARACNACGGYGCASCGHTGRGTPAALKVAQEPDDDAEWLRELAKRVRSATVMGDISGIGQRLERIATRLQAKAPETGEE